MILRLTLSSLIGTTACIAGGLAGIRHGIDGIPDRWKTALRGKKVYLPLLKKLLGKQIDLSNM